MDCKGDRTSSKLPVETKCHVNYIKYESLHSLRKVWFELGTEILEENISSLLELVKCYVYL